MTNYTCQMHGCLNDSGSSLVCKSCKPKSSAALRIIQVWHGIVVEKGREGVNYRCFHCGRPFNRSEVCGDHWPFSKGSRPDLKFDTRNGVCCCMECNTSGSPHRKQPTYEDMIPFLPR